MGLKRQKGIQMKRSASCQITGIILAAAILICSATFAWAGGTTLVWENVSHQVTKGQSLASIAAKVKMTPAALMVFNDLKGPTLRPNMTLHLPKIKQVTALPGKTRRNPGNPYVKAYQIYSANAKCYAMVYVVDEAGGDDEQFLAVYAFDGKAWKELDRIEYGHPVQWSLKHQLKLLSPDKTGNEGCCFYLEYILCPKDSGVDGIVHVPAKSRHLHGVQLVFHAYSYGSQIDDGMPPFAMYGEDIGHAWPDRLLNLKANIERKQSRLLDPDR
jgi:gamma-glutamylcyclotransferase (GGCT)/AIG2-like uncharacterized protein YtfP